MSYDGYGLIILCFLVAIFLIVWFDDNGDGHA